MYASRILSTRHIALITVLSLQLKNVRLPWVQTLLEDMVFLHEHASARGTHYPNPRLHPYEFAQLMLNGNAWRELVKSMHFSWSVLDKNCQTDCSPANLVSLHVCKECTDAPGFATNKALMQHRRIAHGYRDPIVSYIDGSGTCPSCQTCFGSRLRCLAHVTDTRRTKCRMYILENNFSKLSSEKLAALVEIDRTARSLAQKSGRSHAIALGSARTASGKRIGRVSA